METIFQKGKITKGGALLKPLIAIRGHRCEKCGLTSWNDLLIPLQVHHIEQDRSNNKLENLLLLCPNCHAQTESFNRTSKKKYVSDEELAESIKNSSSIHQALLNVNLSTCGTQYARANKIKEMYCIPDLKLEKEKYYCIDCRNNIVSAKDYRCPSCARIASRVVERPSRDEFKNLIRNKSFVEIGKLYGVSDATIRQKWTKAYELPQTKKDIKSYSDEEWELI